MFDMIGLKGLSNGYGFPGNSSAGWGASRVIRTTASTWSLAWGYPSAPAMVGRVGQGPFTDPRGKSGQSKRLHRPADTAHRDRVRARRASTFKRADVRTVGMPLLPEVADIDRTALRRPARQSFGLQPEQKLVVFSGGSLGAHSLTTTALDLADQWKDRDDVVLLIKTGAGQLDDAIARTAGDPVARPVAYIDRMDHAYAAADVMVVPVRRRHGQRGLPCRRGQCHGPVPTRPREPPAAQRPGARRRRWSGDHRRPARCVILGPVLDELLADDVRREAMAHNSRLVDHGAAATTVARWAIDLARRTDLLTDKEEQ